MIKELTLFTAKVLIVTAIGAVGILWISQAY